VEGVLLDDVYVARGDSATGVYIIAEVATCHGLEGLPLTQIGVATGDHATAVHIANQHAHTQVGII
jgi:hypothetical protein